MVKLTDREKKLVIERAKESAKDKAEEKWGQGMPKGISFVATFLLGILTLPLGTRNQYNEGVKKGIAQAAKEEYHEDHKNVNIFGISLAVGALVGTLIAAAIGVGIVGLLVGALIGTVSGGGLTGGTLLNRGNMKRLGTEEGEREFKQVYKQELSKAEHKVQEREERRYYEHGSNGRYGRHGRSSYTDYEHDRRSHGRGEHSR